MVKGQAEVFSKKGRSLDPVQIPKAIKDAGFSVPEVDVLADGTLVKKENVLELNVPGLKHPFALKGGAQGDALKKRSSLIGKKIEISGKLERGRGKAPPGLSVESFKPVG